MPTNSTSDIAPSNEPSALSSPAAVANALNSVGFLGCAVSALLSLTTIVAIATPLVLHREKRTEAASFNLYILILSLADFVKIVPFVYACIGNYGIEWEGTEDVSAVLRGLLKVYVEDMHWDGPLHWCVNGIMFWMVAFISHEIFRLLRNSKQRKRCKPPSLRTVAIHATVASVAGICGAVTGWFVEFGGIQERWAWELLVWSGSSATVWAPLIYSLWVACRVWKLGLMRTRANVGGRLRVLVVYFVRILLVYCGVLASIEISKVVLHYLVNDYGVPDADVSPGWWICNIVWGYQGWLSFAVMVTKPDVGKMVCDLWTGKLCRRNPAATKDETAGDTPPATSAETERTTHESEREDGFRTDDEPEPLSRRERNDRLQKKISVAFIAGVVNYLSDDEEEEDGRSGLSPRMGRPDDEEG